MTLFKRYVALFLSGLLGFSQPGFYTLSAWSYPSEQSSIIETSFGVSALSPAAQYFSYERRSTARYPRQVFSIAFEHYTELRSWILPVVAGSLALTAVLHGIYDTSLWSQSTSLSSAGLIVYSGFDRFFPKLAKRFRPGGKRMWTASVQDLMDETSSSKFGREPTDPALTLKTVVHLLAGEEDSENQNGETIRIHPRLYIQAAHVLRKLIDNVPTWTTTSAAAITGLADLLLNEHRIRATSEILLVKKSDLGWTTLFQDAQRYLRSSLSALLRQEQGTSNEYWGDAGDYPYVFTLYDRMSRFRALMKAEAVRQRNHEPPSGDTAALLERAADDANEIKLEYVKTIDDAFIALAEKNQQAWLKEVIKGAPDEHLYWQQFEVRFAHELNLKVEGDGSLLNVLDAIQSKSGLDDEDVELYSQLAALYAFKAHLVSSTLFTWADAGRYPLIVSSLSAEKMEFSTTQRMTLPKTKRVFDTSVIAAIIHTMEETEDVPTLFDALAPDVITTMEAHRFIARELSADHSRKDSDSIDMYRFVGERQGHETPFSLLPTIWAGRYWLYFLRQFSTELRTAYPEWLVRFHSGSYFFARKVFPFNEPASDETPSIQKILLDVFNRVNRYQDAISTNAPRPSSSTLEERRERNRFLNDLTRTPKQLLLPNPLLPFLERLAIATPSDSIAAFLRADGFQPFEDDSLYWTGLVGSQSLLVKLPGASSAPFQDIVKDNPNALVADLVDGSVAPATGATPWLERRPLRVLALVPGSHPLSPRDIATMPALALIFAVTRQGNSAAALELIRRADSPFLKDRLSLRAGLQEIVLLSQGKAAIHFGSEQLLSVATLVTTILKAIDDDSSRSNQPTISPFDHWFSGTPDALEWNAYATAVHHWPARQPFRLLAGSDIGGLAFAYGDPSTVDPQFHVIGVLSQEFDPGHSGEKTWIKIFADGTTKRMGLRLLVQAAFPERQKTLTIKNAVISPEATAVEHYSPRPVEDWGIGIPKTLRTQLLDVTIRSDEDPSSPVLMSVGIIGGLIGLGLLSLILHYSGHMHQGFFLAALFPRIERAIHPSVEDDDPEGYQWNTRGSLGLIGEFLHGLVNEGHRGKANVPEQTTREDGSLRRSA